MKTNCCWEAAEPGVTGGGEVSTGAALQKKVVTRARRMASATDGREERKLTDAADAPSSS